MNSTQILGGISGVGDRQHSDPIHHHFNFWLIICPKHHLSTLLLNLKHPHITTKWEDAVDQIKIYIRLSFVGKIYHLIRVLMNSNKSQSGVCALS